MGTNYLTVKKMEAEPKAFDWVPERADIVDVIYFRMLCGPVRKERACLT